MGGGWFGEMGRVHFTLATGKSGRYEYPVNFGKGKDI